MLKLIYLAKRKPDLSFDQFVRRWRQHGALGMSQPLWRFAVSYVQAEPLKDSGIAGVSTEYDAVATYAVDDAMFSEMNDDDMPGALAMAEDELETFSCPISDVSLWVQEDVIKAGEPGGITAYLFYDDLAKAHESANSLGLYDALHRVVLNRADEGDMAAGNTLPYKAILEASATSIPALASALGDHQGNAVVTVVARDTVLWERRSSDHQPPR
jgi:hypothetical protein